MYYKDLLNSIKNYLFQCSNHPSCTLTEHGIVNILMEVKNMSQYDAEEAFFNLYTLGHIKRIINSNKIPEYIVW